MAATFSERLRVVLAKGNLRVADAAKIFDRPHSTLDGWINRGLNPGGGPIDVDDSYIMLGKLESYLQRSKLLPVPTRLSPPQRIRYVKKLRVVLLGGKR
jgi:hypothetical protein